jgi:primosomal protein N' (replication factor Y)
MGKATEMVFARIAVNVPAATGLFDYHLPPELEGKIGTGHLVTVPFGKQTVQGVVLELVPVPSVAETKPVLDLLDPLPALTPVQIALAQWLAEETLSPLAACIGLMLPVGLNQQADTLYQLAVGSWQSAVDDRQTMNERNNGRRLRDHNRQSSTSSPLGIVNRQLTDTQARIISLLEKRGNLRGRQIDRHFSQVNWRKSAQYLVRSGILQSQSVLPPPSIRPKFVRTAQLAVPPEQAEAALPDLGKTEATLTRRQSALRFLISAPEPVNVSWVYAESGCNLADLQELAERELIGLRETEIWRDPLQRIGNRELVNWEIGQPEFVLTPAQQTALSEIMQAFSHLPNSQSTNLPFLLHGVTGSGKTEIYLRAAAEAIRRGKQAIILVPEISLTPQAVRRFLAHFPGQVGLVHSKLSEGERYDTWRRSRLGLLKVVIGPRSALFAPLPNVGLIVADECHDGSYYQSEPPFYHAVEAAKVYARLCGAICILGSATPTIVQRYQAEAGESIRMELPQRIKTSEVSKDFGSLGLPPVSIIDMREELKSGNRGIFSRALVEALDEVLKRDEQAILFLNRRGTATYVFCRQCGYVAKCPRCDTPLTYHLENQTSNVSGQTDVRHSTFDLRCHRCGYDRQMPKKCPACGSDQIRQYGLGSEKVEAEVQRLFPQATTLRWDWETTRQKDAHEIILSHFVAHRANVLIGTQMLAKGLDLPLVTLVGVVLADVGLNLPDPFGAERSFQVLTQVAGRAGRSARGGQVILQTFQPEHYAIRHAAGHDYAGFYREELASRQRLGYPPFARLVRLEFRHYDAAKAEAEARAMAEKIEKWLIMDDRRQTTVIGPVPCFFARVAGLYRWQLILRGPEPASLLRGKPLGEWRVEVNPINLL